eukprot:8579407-Karenia_brevis.AAC.1
MIKAEAGVDACNKVVLNAFHDHDIWFNGLKEKPVLEDKDIRERLAWVSRHTKRTVDEWVDGQPHAIIDNKYFQIYTNQSGREHAARRSIR